MKVAEHKGYLFELGHDTATGDSEPTYHAWLSLPNRCLVGCGKASTPEGAIWDALHEDQCPPDVPKDVREALLRSALAYLEVRPFVK